MYYIWQIHFVIVGSNIIDTDYIYDLITLGGVSAILNKTFNLCDSLFTPLHTNPFWKGAYYKRKEFAPNSTYALLNW